jgi:hypothetical protein
MTWYFYRLQDGVFTGGSYSGPERMLAPNTPEGCAALPRTADPAETLRVDIETGELVAYEPPEPSEEAIAASARATRDGRLRDSDWVVVLASERARAMPKEWADYRQALRDVPQQPGFPSAIQWPAPPEN